MAEDAAQQALPRPPVPDLGRTLERYVAGVRAVVPAAQLQETRRRADRFREGEGARLHARLLALADTLDNWVTHFWLDDMYLKNPLPLPVHSNPFFALPRQPFRGTADQLRFAAKLIRFALHFKKQIDSGTLKADAARGAPLCMHSYGQFFPAWRAPGDPKDEIRLAGGAQGDARPWHVVVACRNQFFSVRVRDAEREEDEDALTEQLRQVVQRAKEDPGAPPMGLLTTEDRRTWARLRARLLARGAANAASLRALEHCLFVLCLDEGGARTKEPGRAAACAHLLHGSGTDAAAANRWYDKFMQAVVTKDGVAGLVVEHSASEGITVIRFLEEFLAHLETGGGGEEGGSGRPPWSPSALTWDVDETVSAALQDAARKTNRLCRDVDLFVMEFGEYGKEFIKQQRISPDAYVQVALQLTYYKVHRRLVSTYESASLRRFRLGRVDNIRAATAEALDWVRAMCDDAPAPPTEEEKVRLFEACIQKHTEILDYTIRGEGPDNHLLALRELSAAEQGKETPELFRDKSYAEFLNFRLSTSQLPTEFDVVVGYGPVEPDGYGCCYNVRARGIVFCVTSFFGSKETSSDFFAHSLEGSLLHMAELCRKRGA